MFVDPAPRPAPWSSRWSHLARAAGIAPDQRILLALSGGADSVLLLHLLDAAEPAALVRAVHVDHGLRGEEGHADARFCANLCRALGVPFTARAARGLRSTGPSPEARAREERYRLLIEEALRTGHTTLVTGHHSDDALETLILRWVRGTELSGLRGPREELWIDAGAFGGSTTERSDARSRPRVRIVRPLLPLRREEVRRILADRGLTWREDSSNDDRRFTRTRLRHDFLPALEELCGRGGIENLRSFGRAVEHLERQLAGATAHLAWTPAPYAAATRPAARAELGGVLARAELMRLAVPLLRRALWRLVTEGSGHAPGRALLERLVDDVRTGRCTRHALPGRWTLLIRSDQLHLIPPPLEAGATGSGAADAQPFLPFPSRADGSPDDLRPRPALELSVPGIVTLPDGRRVSAELRPAAPGDPVPHGEREVELDAVGLPPRLRVHWPARGDRFHGLGAPGSKPLSRYLADRGVPREERTRVPLVVAEDEIVWVAGLGCGERHRVRPGTTRRLRLSLLPPPHGPGPVRAPARSAAGA